MEDINIDNNSYLMIVWGDTSNLKVADYSEVIKTNTTNFLDNTININGIGKALLAGYNSPLAQSLASKALPKSTLGRINSSLYDIVADGKISNREVATDFISSCNGELDNVAIQLGLPSASSLYSAIMPDGSGVIATDFLNGFAKSAVKISDDTLAQENENKVATRVLKLKLVIGGNESYSSELPKRRTEKGFNYVDYVNNNEPSFDFTTIIGGVGHNMYDMKDALIEIRNSKLPFDVYINDSVNKKQYHYKNCLFENLDFDTDNVSVNSKQCTMAFEQIPENTIKTTKLTGTSTTSKRKQSGSKKRISSNTKNKTRVQGSVKKTFTVSEKFKINGIKDVISSKLKNNPSYNPLKDPSMNKRASQLGTTLSSLGVTPNSAGSDY